MKKFFTLAAMLLAVASMASAQFVTKALYENEDLEQIPTFDWSKASNFVPIAVSGSVFEAMDQLGIQLDLGVNDVNRHLYVWEGTYVGIDGSGINSFGMEESHIALEVTSEGWSGLGFIDDNGVDFSFLDDSYVLHFAIRSTDNVSHAFGFGKAAFTVGGTAFVDGGKTYKVLGDFPRDGEWYYYDIPYSVLKQVAPGGIVFPEEKGGITNYVDNFLWILSGGVQGTKLEIDNIFFYKDNTIEVEEPAYYLIGSFNGWDENNQIEMTMGEDGKYTITQAMDAGAEFKLRDGEGNWIGANSDGNFIVTKEQVENGIPINMLVDGGMNLQIPVAGTWTITLDPDPMTLVISGEWVEEPAEDPDVYILGNVVGNWDPSVGTLMEKLEDGIYDIEIDLVDAYEGYSYFSFTTKLADPESNDPWGDIAPYRFGAVSEGDFLFTPEMDGEPISLTYTNGQAIKAPAGKYVMSLFLNDMQLYMNRIIENKPGDVDGSGEVDGNDLNMLINILLGKDNDDHGGRENVDGQGGVDGNDLNALINILLGK